jgi:ADP-heptose:LPS heptosyltransferase
VVAVADRRPYTLAVRLDSDGDVLLTGPAVRALAAGSRRLDLLVSPAGRAAAGLLPGVDEVLLFDPPWSGYQPPPVDPDAFEGLLHLLRQRGYDLVVVFTSFHQSALPVALLGKWAGVPRVVAPSEDYPGSLLDVRVRRLPGGAADDGGPGGGHEVEAALAVAEAAGFDLPRGDDGRLRIRPVSHHGPVTPGPYVVVHPAASVPSRSMPLDQAAAVAEALEQGGWHVLVTGGPGQEEVGRRVTPPGGQDLVGRTNLAELASVLSGAACVVVGNTGPAHLAAAVGTPVVSLFSPVVPAERWAPWGVPHVLLGDQGAACRLSRARECPTPGHPCLAAVAPHEVTDAVRRLTGIPAVPVTAPATAVGGAR